MNPMGARYATLAEVRAAMQRHIAERHAAVSVARHAAAELMPNGGHRLLLTLRLGDFSLSRDQATALATALDGLSDGLVLQLLAPFAPAMRSLDDIGFVRRALAAFEEEIAVEDRRGDARTHRARKALL